MAFIVGLPLTLHSSRPNPPRAFRKSTPRTCRPAYRCEVRAVLPDTNPTQETREEAVVQFFVSLGVSYQASVRSAKRYPSLSSAGNLEARARPILEALRDLSLTPEQISRALGHLPTLVLHNSTEFLPRLTFLQDTVNIPFERLPRVIARCPHLLTMDIRSARKVYDMVRDKCEESLPSYELGEAFSGVPQVLVRPRRLLCRNIKWLDEAVGLDQPAQFTRVFSQAPMILVYAIEDNLGPRINEFSKLGLSASTIGRVAAANPELFRWNIERELQPRLNNLTEIVGADGVAGVLEKVPAILDAKLTEHVEWLRDVVELNDEQIKHLIREAPAVLSYSISGNLKAKWAFLKTMGGTKEDLLECPREVFCAALNQRAVPRFAFSSSKGLRLPIPVMLRGHDTEFCAEHGFSYPEYRQYVDDDTYLLFYSQLV